MNRVLAMLSGGGFNYGPTLSGLVADYNLNTAAIAAGWDGIRPLIATVTVAAGAVVYGSSAVAGAAAFTVPSLPEGSLVTIVRDGPIVGRGGFASANGGAGGAGGDALKLSFPVRLKGVGLIAAGGGGGGGGASVNMSGPNGSYSSPGGSGGNGAGINGALTPGVGQRGPVVSGGQTYYAQGGKGGDGGALATAGFSGALSDTGVGTVVSNGTPGVGGSPGRAIVGAEYVTIDGDDLGDIRGAMVFGANSYVPMPAATPSAGAALDGGYYAGFSLWAIVEAEPVSKSRQYTPGILNLYFPGMVANPRLYGGQTVWLKSASNPPSFFLGTVAGAANGLVCINVTNGGGGSSADWVLMAAHRVVVAPKAMGETTTQILSAATAMPLDTYTLTEGGIAQAALLAAAGPGVALAEEWAAGLSIGGRSDWKVPTRDMLEAAYRGLKPVAVNNYVTADRANAQMNSYMRYGAPNDTSNRPGLKLNDPSVPIPANSYYTTGSPSQVGAAQPQFRTGGAEAFEWGAGVNYLTSTAYDASSVWAQSFDSAQAGRQIVVPQTTSGKVRAMRLSMI